MKDFKKTTIYDESIKTTASNSSKPLLGLCDVSVCKITNDKFSWVLEVDGKTITFNGSDNADYFAELYTKFGYNIEWDRDKWQRD